MEQFFPDMGFPDAERACGTGLRHTERTCCWRIRGRWGALKVPEARTACRLSWLDSMLFPARHRGSISTFKPGFCSSAAPTANDFLANPVSVGLAAIPVGAGQEPSVR